MVDKQYSEFNGLINLDKPVGVTSSDCVRLIKKLFKARKVGHGGTLDPFATGILPIGIGKGTKQLQSFLEGHKSYQGAFKIGYLTDTLDCEGKLLELHINQIEILEELKLKSQKLVGSYEQKTPIFSARRLDGQKLYQYARRGIDIEPSSIPSRTIQIDKFEIIGEIDGLIHFNVSCSKGTYVRQLVQDLLALCSNTKVLGTLETLRRMEVGPLKQIDSISPRGLYQKIIDGGPLEGKWCHPL